MIKFIIFLIGFVFIFIFIKRRFINTYIIRTYFNNLSIMVCGKRGSGKDTLFSYIAYKKENNSNIKLNDKTNVVKLSQLCIPNLNRSNLVKGLTDYANFNDYKCFDNITLISDSGIYYPNYEDTLLKKDYPSLAISIAIWRHLYNGSLHFNCQDSGRLWKILREQIEDVIMCLGCKRGKFFTKLKLRYYENYKDSEDKLKPLKSKLIGNNSQINVENSSRGIIKDFIILIPNRMITHNTRAFKDIVFGKEE